MRRNLHSHFSGCNRAWALLPLVRTSSRHSKVAATWNNTEDMTLLLWLILCRFGNSRPTDRFLDYARWLTWWLYFMSTCLWLSNHIMLNQTSSTVPGPRECTVLKPGTERSLSAKKLEFVGAWARYGSPSVGGPYVFFFFFPGKKCQWIKMHANARCELTSLKLSTCDRLIQDRWK